jgi:hypothetical protein
MILPWDFRVWRLFIYGSCKTLAQRFKNDNSISMQHLQHQRILLHNFAVNRRILLYENENHKYLTAERGKRNCGQPGMSISSMDITQVLSNAH